MVICWRARATVAGAILAIYSTTRDNGVVARRCNLSSWYVEPRFRAYAPMLVSHAVRHKNVTYTNVSSAPHTRPTIEAQGFSRYSEGIFVAVPALQGPFGGPAVEVFDVRRQAPGRLRSLGPRDFAAHAAYGCISLWCATSERAYPFVFRRRLVKRFVPCAQLIYCGDVGDFVRFAGPVGRALMRYRPTACPHRRERAHTRPVGVVRPGQNAKIFQRAAPPPAR